MNKEYFMFCKKKWSLWRGVMVWCILFLFCVQKCMPTMWKNIFCRRVLIFIHLYLKILQLIVSWLLLLLNTNSKNQIHILNWLIAFMKYYENWREISWKHRYMKIRIQLQKSFQSFEIWLKILPTLYTWHFIINGNHGLSNHLNS